MKRFVAIAALLVIVVLAGCAQRPSVADDTTAPVSTESEASSVQDDLAEIEALTDDLGLEEIESLDEDLAALS